MTVALMDAMYLWGNLGNVHGNDFEEMIPRGGFR